MKVHDDILRGALDSESSLRIVRDRAAAAYLSLRQQGFPDEAGDLYVAYGDLFRRAYECRLGDAWAFGAANLAAIKAKLDFDEGDVAESVTTAWRVHSLSIEQARRCAALGVPRPWLEPRLRALQTLASYQYLYGVHPDVPVRPELLLSECIELLETMADHALRPYLKEPAEIAVAAVLKLILVERGVALYHEFAVTAAVLLDFGLPLVYEPARELRKRRLRNTDPELCFAIGAHECRSLAELDALEDLWLDCVLTENADSHRGWLEAAIRRESAFVKARSIAARKRSKRFEVVGSA